MADEQFAFRAKDSNNSQLLVEERVDFRDQSRNYRIGIETNLSGVNYFYVPEEKYKSFIESEAKRLSETSIAQ